MSRGRLLAGIALLLGVGAAFAGSPYRGVRADYQVTALELGAWIRDHRPGLRVIDVRPATEFNAYQIPTAEHFPAEALHRMAVEAGEILVVYGDDVAAADRAVARLRSAGHSNVLALRGGVSAWIDDVMNPERSTEVTRYFGGVARSAGSDRTRILRRRGC